MLPATELFPQENCEAAQAFYASHDFAREKIAFRQLPPQPVRTLFYGDSIIQNFPLHEFFPGRSLLNRGIGGDSLDFLYFRMDLDLFPYHPEQVVMLAGCNGIAEENTRMLEKFELLGELMIRSGVKKVYLCSVLPLRHGDHWNRFQYQGKIVELNGMLRKLAAERFAGFIDFHSALKDPAGELAEPFALPDGTHVTLAGYSVMAEVLKREIDL